MKLMSDESDNIEKKRDERKKRWMSIKSQASTTTNTTTTTTTTDATTTTSDEHQTLESEKSTEDQPKINSTTTTTLTTTTATTLTQTEPSSQKEPSDLFGDDMFDDDNDDHKPRGKLDEIAQKLLQSSSLLKTGAKETTVDEITSTTSPSDFDMFNDRVDVDAVNALKKTDEGSSLPKLKKLTREAEPSDDSEGYYCYRLGEVLCNNRYQIIGYHGKGMFSSVLKATDNDIKQEVAIKIIRNNAHMKRTGKKEVEILTKISNIDPESKSNIVRLIHQFEDRDHLCLVFEPMDLNLRQLIKKYGGVGLNVGAVRIYAIKLLRSLILFKKLNIIHADFKPDNILINKTRTVVKVADLGSAMYIDEVEPTPVLVSRYYRAPEIIIGAPYSYPIDMFAYGCCLYELATGKPLLRSIDNNHHLKLIWQVKGLPTKSFLKKGLFKSLHFDPQNRFLEHVDDPGTPHKKIVRVSAISKPTRSILRELNSSYTDVNSLEKRYITQLADLIEKSTEIDPHKRLDPEQALKHPLFKSSSGNVVPSSGST
eukprot:TRINITY_DN636_c0_g1_i1.p1 TRINITY_DN636_c0_g1~~TRINITY_DN636_c0_g1_i1.p1  ORF type:complete len:539 (-),score=153.28 TRINITY_DN636_c0_g1_i1:138-1754(-)